MEDHTQPVAEASALRSVEAFAKRCAGMLTLVTDMDIEVVDAALVRVAGTGIYAPGVGKRVENLGQIRRRALDEGVVVYAETAKSDPACAGCTTHKSCAKKLALAVPIVLNGTVLGVFALSCGTVHDRVRVMVQKRMYIELMQQLGGELGRAVQSLREQAENAAMLAALGQAANSDTRGILVCNAEGAVVFCNRAALGELDPEGDLDRVDGLALQTFCLEQAEDATPDTGEWTIAVAGREARLKGRCLPLAGDGLTGYSLLLVESPNAPIGLSGLAPAAPDLVRDMAGNLLTGMTPEDIFRAQHTLADEDAPGGLPHQAFATTADMEDSGAIEPLEALERRAIQRALAHFGADTKGKQDAAKALGIGIATLYRKLKEPLDL